MQGRIRVHRVDDGGVALFAVVDRPVDVCVDGRRIWTFWTLRDTTSRLAALPGPFRHVAWPRPLVRHLDGRARITVRDSASGQVHLDEVRSFGSGEGRIEVRNEQGVELGFDKSGKLVPTFAGRSETDIGALLDATEAVIAALRDADVEPFLAYGTLLGAVREGTVLAHDSDADLGYVSRFSDPVDVARESFRVQRTLAGNGWRTARHSGAAFKVLVTEGGVTRGLDVFGGFWDRGRLYLMGEIGVDFREEWLRPLGRCRLGGRLMPVPARPEKLLEATYGPGWRVPDPAFRFTTPPRTVRALDDWFRGTQPGMRYWERRTRVGPEQLERDPSVLARRAAAAAAGLGAHVLDVGAGRGADSLWLARQGLSVTAYDYVPRTLERAAATAAAEGLDLQVRRLNLTEWRSVFSEGGLLAHDPRPRVVLARHVLDATSGAGREAFTRLCSMAMREGGRLFADLHLTAYPGAPDPDGDEASQPAEWMVGRADVDELTTLLGKAGASRIDVKRLPRRNRPTVRLVGEWTGGREGPGASAVDAQSGAGAGAAGR